MTNRCPSQGGQHLGVTMIEFILTLIVLAPYSIHVISDDLTERECKDTGAAWVVAMTESPSVGFYDYTCSPVIRYSPTVNVSLEV